MRLDTYFIYQQSLDSSFNLIIQFDLFGTNKKDDISFFLSLFSHPVAFLFASCYISTKSRSDNLQ